MDIAGLTDEAAAKYRKMKLVPSAAVWAVLREHRLNEKPEARALAKKMLSRLGQRGAARRRKNDGERKHDVSDDIMYTIAERGGDPDD